MTRRPKENSPLVEAFQRYLRLVNSEATARRYARLAQTWIEAGVDVSLAKEDPPLIAESKFRNRVAWKYWRAFYAEQARASLIAATPFTPPDPQGIASRTLGSYARQKDFPPPPYMDPSSNVPEYPDAMTPEWRDYWLAFKADHDYERYSKIMIDLFYYLLLEEHVDEDMMVFLRLEDIYFPNGTCQTDPGDMICWMMGRAGPIRASSLMRYASDRLHEMCWQLGWRSYMPIFARALEGPDALLPIRMEELLRLADLRRASLESKPRPALNVGVPGTHGNPTESEVFHRRVEDRYLKEDVTACAFDFALAKDRAATLHPKPIDPSGGEADLAKFRLWLCVRRSEETARKYTDALRRAVAAGIDLASISDEELEGANKVHHCLTAALTHWRAYRNPDTFRAEERKIDRMLLRDTNRMTNERAMLRFYQAMSSAGYDDDFILFLRFGDLPDGEQLQQHERWIKLAGREFTLPETAARAFATIYYLRGGERTPRQPVLSAGTRGFQVNRPLGRDGLRALIEKAPILDDGGEYKPHVWESLPITYPERNPQ